MIDFFRTKTLVRKGSRNGRRKMDGNPKRQAQRNELHRVREKISHRPACLKAANVKKLCHIKDAYLCCK